MFKASNATPFMILAFALVCATFLQPPALAEQALSADDVAFLVAASGTCSSGWEVQCDGAFCSTVCQASGEVGALLANPAPLADDTSADSLQWKSEAESCEEDWDLRCNGGTCCTVCQSTGEIGDCHSAN